MWALPAQGSLPLPVIIEPVRKRLKLDISIPITGPPLKHDIRKSSDLDVRSFDAIFGQEDLAEEFGVDLRSESVTTETEVHKAAVATNELQPAQELIANIANKFIELAKLPYRFAPLYPAVPEYVGYR